MKKSLLSFFASTLFLTAVFAQPSKGTLQIGTSTALWGGINSIAEITPNNNAGISYTKTKTKFDGDSEDGPSNTNFNVSPKVGFAAADGLIVGLNFDFLFIKSKDDDDEENKITGIAAGPFVRYYIPSQGNAVPFVEAGGSFGRITSQFNDNDKDKTNTVGVNLGVGSSFFFNDFVSFDILAGYFYNSTKDPDSNFDIKNIAHGFGLGVGLSVFIDGGEKE